MKKALLTLLVSLCFVLALAAFGAENSSRIQYRFADKAEGQALRRNEKFFRRYTNASALIYFDKKIQIPDIH